jgi:LmbE family N-acetylglucosaminyl deacetylase
MGKSGITSLIISPHVDDEILGCGGILGKDCFAYYCGIDESKWNDMSKIVDAEHRIPVEERFRELQAVSDFLGFKFECNFDSAVNMFTEREFIPTFEELINRIKPEKVYIPHPGYNQDHRRIFEAAFTALRPHDKNFFVKKVLVYEAPHDVLWTYEEMKLNYFVPIDIEKKIQAYLLHKSQVRSYRSSDMLRRIAKLRGDMSNCEYAEAFQILRWVDSGSS